MLYVFPDYYKDFRCIGGSCGHNCCIGWEIDIDPDTAAFYDSVPGELGRRLRENIAPAEPPHFMLGQEERCPFLNKDNLCDIILTLGEEHICDICRDHPRFRNQLPGRLETGLGLCCEEAGKLILGRETPVYLEISGQEEVEDEYLLLRDQAIALLQTRSLSMEARTEGLLALCGASMPPRSMETWAEILLGLERLDQAWTHLLEKLRTGHAGTDYAGFDTHMAPRQKEYENFTVYLLYRHLANACDETDLAARAAFAVFGYRLLRTLGALIWTETGDFTFPQQVELARLFSSEIEYSDENLDILLDELI